MTGCIGIRQEDAYQEALPEEIKKAVIAHRGRLTDRFRYLGPAAEAAATPDGGGRQSGDENP